MKGEDGPLDLVEITMKIKKFIDPSLNLFEYK